MTVSYLALVRLRPARRLIYALSAAALSFGMVSLTLLLTVARATGSYPDGGFAVGAFALAAGISAPVRGRLVDRRGARTWLPALALGYAASLVALDVIAHRGAPMWVLVGLGGAIGISTPPLFSSARAVWRRAVGPTLLRRGYAVTALLGDAGQVAGPVLASLLFLVSGWLAPLVCASAGLVGAFLSLPERDPTTPRAEPTPMPRLFANRRLPGLLAISIALGGGVGLVQVGVPTVAGRWHHASLSGPLLAAFGFGSVLGALWYGSRSWRWPVIDRYLWSVVVVGVLLAPGALAGGPSTLAPVLVLAGLAFGPATVSLFEALDVLAPGSGAEALTWVTTAEASGQAGGSAIAALLATHAATWAPFALASLLFAAPALLALAVRGRVRR
jgi:predicted MFS family arabinose efflux permease